LTGNYVCDPDRVNWELVADTTEEVIDNLNHNAMRVRAEAAFYQRKIVADHKKQQVGVIDDYTRGMLNQHMKEQGVTVPETQSLSYHIDLFVKFQENRHKQGKIKAGQLEQLTIYMNYYGRWAKEQRINHINAIGTIKAVDAYFYHLTERLGTGQEQIEPSYAKKLFNCFKRFVQFLIDERVLENIIPPWNNRRDDKYTIREILKKPETISLTVLRQVHDAAPPRLKLFMSLVLNCGFGASEIGQLTKGEYDRKNGRIVHKRVKTGDCDNVPTVTYRLWSRTVELLENQIETQKQYPTHDEYRDRLLLNTNGRGLWYEYFDNGSHKENDSISQQFERFITQFKKDKPDFPRFTFYMLRRTASTAISNHKIFGHLDSLGLGHAPRTTAGRHYTVPDADRLDDCIVWLERKLLTIPSQKMMTKQISLYEKQTGLYAMGTPQ
jgi:integrase